MATAALPLRPPTGHVASSRPLSLQSQKEALKSPIELNIPSHIRGSSRSSAGGPSPHGSSLSSRVVLPDTGYFRHPPNKRLRSQYPLDSPEPHVEYILVASFDIDRGSIMEHQYPHAISPDENMLAELMLPDQTHTRQQDWTMFFLHKDGMPTEDEEAERELRRQRRKERRLAREQAAQAGIKVGTEEQDGSDSESDSDEAGPPLMYALNLVFTKHDSTKRRGAVVKAMAICTRHSFLHIYKPVLLLALEDYFKSPVPDTLELLYHALNTMDLSLMPKLTTRERHILEASDIKDMFVEKFEDMISQRIAEEASGKVPSTPDSPSRALAKYNVPRDTHDFESKIVYNAIPIPVKVPTALAPETVGDFSLVKLVQTFGNPHISQPQPFALHPHLTTSGANTHPILVLINALLTGKRVIFLGHNRPSGEVAEAVLAACALGSGGILRGFTRHAFPYTDLTKVDQLLNVPGFVAGVTNPTFSNHPEWWDLLCDIPTGRMKISSKIEPAPVTEGSTYFQQFTYPSHNQGDPTGDVAFMDGIIESIAARSGESMIRAKFRNYITKFTRIAAVFEETVYGASALTVLPPAEMESSQTQGTGPRSNSLKSGSDRSVNGTYRGHGYVWASEDAKNRELAASAARIEGWRNTRSYFAFVSDLATQSKSSSSSPTSSVSMSDMLAGEPVKTHLDIYHCLSKLRTLRLTATEAGAIYIALDAYCVDYDSILELLELAPLSESGLYYVSLGLWHENVKVREAVALLLERIKDHMVGRHFYSRLGGFAKMGLMRTLQERDIRLQGQPHEEDEAFSPLSIPNGNTRNS